jgi:hypothetical protein
MMQDVVKSAISERAMTKAGKGSKPDFLDLDKDGNKKEPMKKAAKDAKKKPVKESMQHMSELAHHHAGEYAKAHKTGELEKAMHHKRQCEECGGMISHGPMGECWMSHAGISNGKAQKVEGVLGGLAGAGIGGAVGGLPGAAMGYVAGSKVGDDLTSESKKAKPDFLDMDKDGNKKEPMKKAIKDKKAMKESIEMKIRRYIAEGEEGKAELIMAVKDMVDKFTGWSEDIAQMQAQTAMEMADHIRDELGNDQASAFTAAVTPALDSAFQAVKSAREALNSTVGTLTGEGGPAPMGATPPDMGGMDDMGPEMPTDDIEDDGEDLGAVVPTSDREKRESIEFRNRLTKILVGR